jgi:hypothetical protein
VDAAPAPLIAHAFTNDLDSLAKAAAGAAAREAVPLPPSKFVALDDSEGTTKLHPARMGSPKTASNFIAYEKFATKRRVYV